MLQIFLLIWGRMLAYTLGVLVACGLAVEICYRLCFLVMGERIGRTFWRMTAWFGTPVHELGHALMCLLFAHRIEHIRLFSTRHGSAQVQHSYNKRNLYAVFGNFWIGLGPIFTGIGMILLLLWLAFPAALDGWFEATRMLLATATKEGDAVGAMGECIRRLLGGMWSDHSHPLWARLLALGGMFCMALHVRLSASDVVGMLSGLPGFALLTALCAGIATAVGEVAQRDLVMGVKQLAWLVVTLFALILLLGVLQLVLAILCRLVALFWCVAFRKE